MSLCVGFLSAAASLVVYHCCIDGSWLYSLVCTTPAVLHLLLTDCLLACFVCPLAHGYRVACARRSRLFGLVFATAPYVAPRPAVSPLLVVFLPVVCAVLVQPDCVLL